MGASDMPKAKVAANVPQEIVCTVYSASPDAIEKMTLFIVERGFSVDRFKIGWDTWRGTTFAPPEDTVPWSILELNQLRDILEQHPNTVCVDTTPGSGSGG